MAIANIIARGIGFSPGTPAWIVTHGFGNLLVPKINVQRVVHDNPIPRIVRDTGTARVIHSSNIPKMVHEK